nr:polynucleotide 5' hydroxyl kinase NOL9 [Hymenolepis microstoma]
MPVDYCDPCGLFVFGNNSVFIRVEKRPIIWLCLLSPESSWLIFGRSKLTVLRASNLQLCGADLCRYECVSFNIYSPSTHTPSDIKITSCSPLSDLNINNIFSQISNLFNISSDHLQYLSECPPFKSIDFSRFAAALVLQSLESPVIDSIQEIQRFKKLFAFNSKIPNKVSITGETYSFESASVGEGYVEPPELFDLFQSLSNVQETRGSKIIVCGPSNSGKSSLLRRLVNHFLCNHEAVAFLDCDPGQTEFTPPGMLSLTIIKNFILGPPFTHPLNGLFKPKRQCFFGGTSPSVNPSFYVNCMRYVFEAFKEVQGQIPLVINTMGWTQGLGLTLLIEQIVIMKPDIVVQLYLDGQRANTRSNLPELTSQYLHKSSGWNHSDLSGETFNHRVVCIPSMSRSGPGGFTSAQDQRDLTLLAHLLTDLVNAPTSLPGSGPRGRGNTSLGHPTAHLLDCLPYRVPLTSSADPDIPGMIAVHLLHQPSDVLQMLPVYTLPGILNYLNGALVALCSVDRRNICSPSGSNGLSVLSCDPCCDCIGLAVVRAIDPSAGVIYLTTGIPQEELINVNSLIRGKVDLPQLFFIEYPYSETLLSYPESENQEEITNPYVGPQSTPGTGGTGLPARRYTPRTMHHSTGYSFRDANY